MAATPRSSPELSLPQLTTRLKSADWAERLHAALALSGMGQAATAAVPALVETLRDADSHVRKGAILALGHIGAGSDPVLRGLGEVLLHDAEPSIRGRAAEVLGRVAAEEAIPVLEAAYAGEEDEEVSERIALALAEIEGRGIGAAA
jgi:HEAT repeat protein